MYKTTFLQMYAACIISKGLVKVDLHMQYYRVTIALPSQTCHGTPID